jgi:hypothetical protein
MKVVTEKVKVELEKDERVKLLDARAVLGDFLVNMRDNHCLSAFFEEYGYEVPISEIQKAYDIIDILSDENPIIE